MTAGLLHRLRAMDAAELRFRATTAVRNRVDRARTALAPESWRREALRLSTATPVEARRSLERTDWMAAHLALAEHFAARAPRFVVDPRRLPAVAAQVSRLFPAADANRLADAILAGRYDLLGYRDVAVGTSPDWHRDPVHDRRAPLLFWDSVPYLDPALGDHKITWELNRHQHFLLLGRAHARSGDRRYYDEFVRQVTGWMDANPPLIGTNWASMLELAFRSLSWLWALHFFAGAASDRDDSPWVVDLLLALGRQLEHVEQNLSRYFSPNTHLTGEALALYVCGRALPELSEAEHWADTGRAVLYEEATRQVLADGGHAELSAHYHRYSTDFYLLALGVARVSGDAAAQLFDGAARRQAHFLRGIADDTGRLPLTGDDDGGQLLPICRRSPADAADTLATAAVLLDDPTLHVGPVPEETYWACATTSDIPGTPITPHPAASAAFAQSGYYVSRVAQRGDHLVFDAGRHGFLNGGHAHADALAIILTVGNRPLLVDPGTGTYTMDPEVRDRFRSAAMHNTVVLNGRAPSLPKGPFHWQTRTDAACSVWQPGTSADYAEGYHHGYRPVVHVRAVASVHGLGWIVIDHVLGGDGHAAIAAMWHIHPDWAIDRSTERGVRLRHDDGWTTAVASSAALLRCGDGLDDFAPEYGRIEKGLCFRSTLAATAPVTICTFIDAVTGREMPAVSTMPITIPPPAGVHGAAFRVDTEERSLVVLASVEMDRRQPAISPGDEPVWGAGDYTTRGRTAILDGNAPMAAELCLIRRGLASSVHLP